ncbi:MAG: hypothetical protein P1V97_24980, partial [Planctomycetota bacterium]|nr:hypothetical protein [Planctomycetota bacterium]
MEDDESKTHCMRCGDFVEAFSTDDKLCVDCEKQRPKKQFWKRRTPRFAVINLTLVFAVLYLVFWRFPYVEDVLSTSLFIISGPFSELLEGHSFNGFSLIIGIPLALAIVLPLISDNVFVVCMGAFATLIWLAFGF